MPTNTAEKINIHLELAKDEEEMSQSPLEEVLPPMCVDLDGTLVNTDIFLENLLILIKKQPKMIFMMPIWYLKGKAYFKNEVIKRSTIDYEKLPYNKQLIYFLKKKAASGQKLILVTGSTESVAYYVAKHLKIFDGIYASTQQINLTGKRKAFLLNHIFGKGCYDYIGDSRVDIAVWKCARKAYAVNASRSTCHKAAKQVRRFSVLKRREVNLKAFTKSLRVHQWLKNVLVFAPMVFANTFELSTIFKSILAFAAFSLVASSGYIFNDLLDIPSDRTHPSKRKRPFASGQLSINAGLLLIPLLLGGSLFISTYLGMKFALIVAGYFILTTNYTLWIKRIEVADVIVLAGFYSLRLHSGAVATDINLSSWLLAFTTFFFLSLALIKRSSELIDRIEKGGKATISRGYTVTDHPQLRALGTASGFMSVLVLALYINSETIRETYRHPDSLWGICVLLTYWISRFWVIANRGQVDYDPVIFAAKDRVTHIVGILMALFWLSARGWF